MKSDGRLILVGGREFRTVISGLFDRLAQNDQALVYAPRGRPSFIVVRLPPVRAMLARMTLYTTCCREYERAFGTQALGVIHEDRDIPTLKLNDLRREPGRVQQELNFDMRPRFLTWNRGLAAVVARVPGWAGLEEARLFASRIMEEAHQYADR